MAISSQVGAAGRDASSSLLTDDGYTELSYVELRYDCHVMVFLDHIVNHMTLPASHMTLPHHHKYQCVPFSLQQQLSLSLSPARPHLDHTAHTNNHQGNPAIVN